MASPSSSSLSFFALAAWFLVFMAHAADEDPLQDFCVADIAKATAITINGFVCKPAAAVQPQDFKNSILNKPGNTNNKLGFVATAANVMAFPGLNTLGVSFTRLDFAPHGLNPPHIHPRGTELLFLLQGTLYVGFIDTTNKLFAQTIYAGDLFVFPRGLIHFQLNIGKEAAVGISGFNSQNPGTSQVAKAVFTDNPPVNNDVLQIAFQLYPQLVDELRQKISQT